MFSVDVNGVRERFAETEQDDLPCLWGESPATDIEDVFLDLDDAGLIGAPGAWRIQVRPLRYESDSDSLLITVYEDVEGRRNFGLCGIGYEWDNYVPVALCDHPPWTLFPEHVIEIAEAIVAEANRLLNDHFNQKGASPCSPTP